MNSWTQARILGEFHVGAPEMDGYRRGSSQLDSSRERVDGRESTRDQRAQAAARSWAA